MEIRRRQTSAQSAPESAALGVGATMLLESDKLRAVPSAQTEKEPQAALFLCAETLIGVWKYACKVFCAICIRIRSPRQGWDIAAQKRTVGDDCPCKLYKNHTQPVGAIHESPAALRQNGRFVNRPYRKAGLLYISLPHLPHLFSTISCKPVAFCICILTFPRRRAMIIALCRFGTKKLFSGDKLCLN